MSHEIVFYSLPYSPWSEKARWALDFHQIDYREENVTPVVDNLKFKFSARRPLKKVTYPILKLSYDYIFDSLEIVKWAEKNMKGKSIIDFADYSKIKKWNDFSDELLNLIRYQTLIKAKLNWEILPPPIRLSKKTPQFLSREIVKTNKWGIEFILKKYPVEDVYQLDSLIREKLNYLETELCGKDYLLDQFSYADIAVSVCLQLFDPPDLKILKINPGMKAMFKDNPYIEEFPYLFRWRNNLYQNWRH